MIIQCGKCSAKFRFDDTLVREEGVWVRCSLCEYEFFQCHPLSLSPKPTVEINVSDDGDIRMDRDVETQAVRLPEELSAEPDIHEGEHEPAALKKSRRPGVLKIFTAAFVVLLVMGGLAFFTFPDMARQAIADLASYLPWIGQEEPQKPSIEDGILVEANNQRFVVNVSAGNLRIVEGMLLNQSGHSVARLQVKATLVDAQDNRLGEKLAYAGHMLSDAELTVLKQEEINRRLDNPRGSTTSNERILPGGRIPFMIVWAFEPPGAARTYVTMAGVERLPR
jgi:predicted Zn finger-like uncharacterized protein